MCPPTIYIYFFFKQKAAIITQALSESLQLQQKPTHLDKDDLTTYPQLELVT